MRRTTNWRSVCECALLVIVLLSATSSADDKIVGKVSAGSAPVGKASVTLWEAGPGAAEKLAETKTNDAGEFELSIAGNEHESKVLYLTATGSSPSVVFMATLGSAPPERVVVNELTTVASVWTGAQFLEGTEMSGPLLGLRVAADNVPNLVDLGTGGLGSVIQDGVNSCQTTTLAKVNTLGNLLVACIRDASAAEKLFEIATPPGGTAPADLLTAMQNIARHPSHRAEDLFKLFQALYPIPDGKEWREVPRVPYMSFAPRAWTLSLVYTGGGVNSAGGICIDSENNFWSGNNFLVGAQSTIYRSFGGGVSKLSSNGRPLSPMTTGFRGGGVDGPGFGLAISRDDKVWVTSLAGKNISVFDRTTGKPLSPEEGYNLDGKLGQMQGIIVTPNGDVWALDNENSQIVYLPGGDASKGRILGRTEDGKPVDGTLKVKAPFHLAIDQQDRIWVTNSGSDTVTRFPASNPEQAEEFKVGFAPRAIAIDSQGNAWVCNTVGHPGAREKAELVETVLKAKFDARFSGATKDDQSAQEWISLYEILNKFPGGDVSMIRPDGTVLGPFNAGNTINGPWGVAIDGDDHVWVANSTGHSVAQLCGARPENAPPGLKAGDPISPPGGYIGGLQIITDVAIDAAGNVWVVNNWQLPEEVGFKKDPEEAISTRFGGNGAVVFFGLAKPVQPPLIGPVRTQ